MTSREALNPTGKGSSARGETKTRTSKTTLNPSSAHHKAAGGGNTEGAGAKCENCGSLMVGKLGRFGEFLACTNYPDCKTTRKTQKAGEFTAAGAVVEGRCPQCDAQHLVLKQGRYGPFTACSNYPKCKYVKPETTGVSCPECGIGELVVKRTTRGAFYGCGNYPGCKFTMRDKPIQQACPECGARFIVEHRQKDGSRRLQCRTGDCRFKEADSPPGNESIRSGN